MTTSLSDADAIGASFGDPEAFGVLFDRHFPAVVAFVGRRLGQEPACEIATDVFVVAFKRRGTFDLSAASALPWLLGIAANQVLAERRRFGRYLAAVERLRQQPSVASFGDTDPYEALESAEFASRMREALLRLPDHERELLLLVAWENFTYEQAANAFGLPIGTVRSKIHRTRRRLRQLLGPDQIELKT